MSGSVSIMPSAVPVPARRGRVARVVFGMVFALFGIGFLIPLCVIPAYRVYQANQWRATPCTILESRVESNTDSDGATYRVRVRYEYVFNDRNYIGDRYNFAIGSSSGPDAKIRVVQSLPPGRRVNCWVDPADASSSVIDRKLPGDLWFGLIPSIFIAVGAILMFAPAGSKTSRIGQGLSSNARSYPDAVPGTNMERSSGPVELRPQKSPLGTFFIVLIIAAVWDSVVGIMVVTFVSGMRHGSFTVVFALFTIPFLLVGIALLVAVVYQLLAVLNPRPTVLLARSMVSPGETDEVRWQFDGRFDRISRLTIHLEGREEATYRQGTTTATDKNVFSRTQLLDTTKQGEIANGRRPFTIPAGTMHSLHASNNRITWVLLMHGQIARWPDVAREYAIDVAPANARSHGPGEAMVNPPQINLQPDGRELWIELAGRKSSYVPGARVAGVARWNLLAAPSDVQVRLFWYTSGKGTRDTGMVQALTVPEATNTGAQPFEFVLPPGPYSFSGKLISLAWAIEVVVEPGSRAARAELMVGPDEREVLLESVPAQALSRSNR